MWNNKKDLINTKEGRKDRTKDQKSMGGGTDIGKKIKR